MKYSICATMCALAFASSSYAAQYKAVPAFTGSAKMGINCVHAPAEAGNNGIASQCQQFIPPTNPRIEAQFPVPPSQYNVMYRNPSAKAFSEFSGYPMVVEMSQDTCYLRNPLVNTILAERNVSPELFKTYEYACSEGNRESFDNSSMIYKYTVSGAFQPQNDAHFYAGVTMQMALDYYSDLFPNQAELCPSSGYCIKQVQLRVNYSHEGQDYSSNWDGEYVNLAPGGNTFRQFAHGSALDIVSHEIGHAILSWNSDLLYQGGEQSAIHEAFSDMTAVAVRDYYFKHLQVTESNFTTSPLALAWQQDNQKKWWFGIDRNFSQSPVRYLNYPRLDLYSVDDHRDLADAVGPHQQSGVLNKFFYLLSNQNGWDIERAYKLVLTAAKDCFNRQSSIEHAGYCLIQSTVEKQLVSHLLQQVGIVPSNANVDNLDFSIDRLLDEANYQIIDNSFYNSQVQSLNVKVNGESQLYWRKNNGQGNYQSVKGGRVILQQGANTLALELELKNGQIKTGYRLLYGASEPRCIPNSMTPALTDIRINGELFRLDNSYEFVELNTPIHSLDELKIDFLTALNNRYVSLFSDSNRNRVFEVFSDPLSNELIFGQPDVANSVAVRFEYPDSVMAGPLLMRIRIDDQQESACNAINSGQVVDFLVNFKQGGSNLAVDFSHSQVNNDVTFKANGTGATDLSYNWYFDSHLVAENKTQFTKVLSGATLVRVDMLSKGQVVASEERVVSPVANPNLAIQCQVTGSSCEFNISHEQLPASARYFWTFGDVNNTKDTRYNANSFNFDYRQHGQYEAVLELFIDELNTQFKATTVVNISTSTPDFNFDYRVDASNSQRLIFTPDLAGVEVTDIRWNIEQSWVRQSDLSGTWTHTFSEPGVHTVYMAITDSHGSIHTTSKSINVKANTQQPKATINQAQVMMKYGSYSMCYHSQLHQLAKGDNELNSYWNFPIACVSEITVDGSSSDGSAVLSEYWIDLNRDNQFQTNEKNITSTFNLSEGAVNVCVVAYTEAQGPSVVPCDPTQGRDSMQFKIVQ
ncbi:hypothetical protein EXT48_04380 [Pseudoalteromonas sp. CO348]|uniref:M4 family metallopeptidase n=1 Tax=Pseudoalteromonas sp. CO348 TaxID=1777271 RepID=UPI0010233A59|nr:M4 family metallopeptidase [Pseudoalteromonas sp. CO348]RZG08328.1 hypothetical protein EXT48_04380 [Pseudoalteromonas sp. CO348]